MFEVVLTYTESGKKYTIPFDVVKKFLKLTDKDIEKLKIKILKEVSKE